MAIEFNIGVGNEISVYINIGFDDPVKIYMNYYSHTPSIPRILPQNQRATRPPPATAGLRALARFDPDLD